MFCQKCGKELPEGAKFCNYCGEVQQEVSAGDTNPTVNNRPQTNQVTYKEPKKSKGKTWKIVAVIAVILALIGGISQKKLQEKDASDLKSSQETVEENPEFTKIFEERNIVAFDDTNTMLDHSTFAHVDENNIVDRVQIFYDNDTVCEIEEQIFIDVEDMTQEQITVLKENMYAQYEGLGGNANFEYDGSVCSDHYFGFRIKAENLNNPSVLQQAVDGGLLTLQGEGELLSASMTEQAYLDMGYVEK